jgi:peptide deformylase
MIRPIVQVGDPVLRERARELEPGEVASVEVQALVDDLVETMRAAGGAGLAAPQVGVPLRLFVVEVRDNPRYPYKPPIPLRVLANPELRPLGDETFPSYEGCLSVPDIRGIVPRHAMVEVAYLDRDGARVRERVRGLSAGTFQHELDHLDGTIFLDRVDDRGTLTTWEGFRRFHERTWLEAVQRWIADSVVERINDEEEGHGGQ